jgi:hypothetical protein
MYRSHAGDMGPVNLVAYYRQKLGLKLLLHWLAWKRNWVRIHGLIDQRAEDCVGIPFSREQWDPSKSVGDSWKVAMHWPREICMVWDHTRTKRGMRVAYWLGFPCMVYIDSNHRDSQIWVPLVCGSHHIDNLMNLMSLSVIDVCCLLHLIACNSCLSRVWCNLLRNDLNRARTWK